MGVGPGGGDAERWIYGYGSTVGAHSEFTRMLAEHGLFGLISLISILLLSYFEYRKRVDYNRMFFSLYECVCYFNNVSFSISNCSSWVYLWSFICDINISK